MAGLSISSASPSARAEPAPVAPAAAPVPPPYAYAPQPQVGAVPGFQVPTYVYIPGDGTQGFPVGTEGSTKRGWYGWQTLLVFGGATTVGLLGGLAGGASDSPGVWLTSLGLGGAGLLLGGPIIHWAHGNTGKGFGALGLNFGMPLVGAGLGAGIVCVSAGCDSDQGIDIFLGVVVGGSLGLIASMILDVTVLSYENEPIKPVVSRRAPGWKIVPDLKITREKTTFGFAGVF